MTERILPEPDHFATCPMDGRILTYYKGIFDSVFILLHPFIRPISIEKVLFKADTYPGRTSIATGCVAVSWSEIMQLTGLPSLSAVDIGLRTGIGGLSSACKNPEFARVLGSLYDTHAIIEPPEGKFSDLLHDIVLACFQYTGHRWVWVGDEFGTERKLYWIEDLTLQDERIPNITAGHCNVQLITLCCGQRIGIAIFLSYVGLMKP